MEVSVPIMIDAQANGGQFQTECSSKHVPLYYLIYIEPMSFYEDMIAIELLQEADGAGECSTLNVFMTFKPPEPPLLGMSMD